MKEEMGLVFFYGKHNRYSFNALAGAVETVTLPTQVGIHFVNRGSELISALGTIFNRYHKVIIGFSFFSTQLWEIKRLVKALRNRYGNKPFLIAGGPHPTGDPLGTLRAGFDLVVRGEGEETLIELLEKTHEGEEYTTVKGIAFIDEAGDYHVTGGRPPLDLDTYPPFAFAQNKFGAIEITRGCPFGCAFCQTPHIFGGQVRHRSVEKIVDGVQLMKERNLSDIRFITTNAFSYGSADGKALDISKLEKLLSSIKEITSPTGRIFMGSFPSEVRPEHVTKETVSLVLKYADNDNLVIGAQSGSQRILDLCRRGHTVSDIYGAVDLTLASGLKANVDFIFGLPQEDEDDVQLTVKLMGDLVKMGARIHAHTFMPLPQTPFAHSPAGRVPDDIKKVLKGLIHQGAVFGEWVKQEELAKAMECTQ